MTTATAVDTGTDYGNPGPIPLQSPSVSATLPTTSLEPAPESSGFPGTSPTPVPTTATGVPAYNPLSAQPYTPPSAVPVQALPSAASALGPDTPANGAVNHTGAVAYGLDQVLRGYMKGTAIRQATQAIQLYKQSAGLQKNLDMASQQYYNLAKAGTDPSSPEMQSAKSQVDAAFQANMDFMKQHVAGQQIDKKTGQLKPQQGSILSRLTGNQDPAAQSLAVYQGAQALGPPVYHQAAQFLTPQYQAYAKTQAQTAGLTNVAAQGAQEIALQRQNLQQEFNTLNVKRPEELSEADVERRDQLGDILGQPTEAAAAKSELIRRVLASPIPIDQQTRLIAQINSKGAGAFTPTTRLATAGSFGEQLDRVAAAHGGMTRAQLPPEVVEAYKQRWAWDSRVPTSTTRTQMIETEDPVTHEKTQTPVAVPGSSAPGPRPSVPSGWEDPAEAAIPSSVAHPSAAAAGIQAHTQTLDAGKTPAQAQTAAKVAANSVQRSWTGGIHLGTPIQTGLPGKQSPEEQKVYEAEDAAKMNLDTGLKASTSLDDQGLMTAWSRGHLGGRVAQQELSRIQGLGGAEMRLEGGVAQLVNGKLTPAQHQMFIKGLQDNYNTIHARAEQYRNRTPGVGQTPSSAPATGGSGAAAGGGAADPAVADILQKLQQLGPPK